MTDFSDDLDVEYTDSSEGFVLDESEASEEDDTSDESFEEKPARGLSAFKKIKVSLPAPKKDTKKVVRVVTERALAVVEQKGYVEPPQGMDEFVRHVRITFTAGRFETACSLLQDIVAHEKSARTIGRLFQVLHSGATSRKEPVPTEAEFLIIETARLFLKRLLKIPKKQRGTMPLDAIKLCLRYNDSDLHALMLDALIKSKSGQKQFSKATETWAADEEHEKLFALLLSRTEWTLDFILEVDPKKVNMNNWAFLVARAMDRGVIGQRMYSYTCKLFVQALFFKWDDRRVAKFMRIGMTKGRDRLSKKSYIDRYMSDGTWFRLMRLEYMTHALWLIRWGLSLYPIVWTLQYIFPTETTLTEKQAVFVVDRMFASYWRILKEKASRDTRPRTVLELE